MGLALRLSWEVRREVTVAQVSSQSLKMLYRASALFEIPSLARMSHSKGTFIAYLVFVTTISTFLRHPNSVLALLSGSMLSTSRAVMPSELNDSDLFSKVIPTLPCWACAEHSLMNKLRLELNV